MKRFGFLFILMFIVSACGQAPTPTATPDVPATAAVFASTMVASTLTAQPTWTQAPTATPLPTDTPTTAPTETPVPTLAPGEAATASALATQALIPQASPTLFVGTFSPGDITGLETALLEIDNLSGEKQVIVSLTCKTRSREQVVYYNQTVSKTMVIRIVVGSCQVLVQIPNKRYMSITFSQTNKDKTVMGVYLTKVVVHGP